MGGHSRIGLVENDKLMAAGRERDLALGEELDLIPHDVDTALVRGVELEDTLLVRVAEEGVGQTVDRGRLSNTRQALGVSVLLWGVQI